MVFTAEQILNTPWRRSTPSLAVCLADRAAYQARKIGAARLTSLRGVSAQEIEDG
jgi:hypothetical protein